MTTSLEDTPFYRKALGCLVAGFIGDALGAPAEGKTYRWIDENLGWLADFSGGGTDDTMAKHLLIEALIRSDGDATMDDWAQVWLDNWSLVVGGRDGKSLNATITYNTRKLRMHMLPVTVGAGSMPTSTAPMCISPVGIVNACNPRQAFLQAWDLAGVINAQETSYCRDAAAVMAAATAEAFSPGASVASVLQAATRHLAPVSGKAMREAVQRGLELARATPDYMTFRRDAFDSPDRVPLLAEFPNNPFETTALTLALFYLAGGDVEKCITYGANFGRDADTVASMCGAIAGALHGVDSIRPDWLAKVKAASAVSQEELAGGLVGAALSKSRREAQAHELLQSIAG